MFIDWLKNLLFPSKKLHVKMVKITCYGYHDNDPPGKTIAYPIIHEKADGVGTFEDPITFAANPNIFDPGTVIFIPIFSKYFIMEDVCGASLHRKDSELPIVDIWIGGSEHSNKEKLNEKEMQHTKENATIFMNPHDKYTVNSVPLFTD